MFPLANLYFELSVDYVPDENIYKNLKELCIRLSNLKFPDLKNCNHGLHEICCKLKG